MDNNFAGVTADQRVLVLGASGMLGNAVYRLFSESDGFQAFGTVRSSFSLKHFSVIQREGLVVGVDVDNTDSLVDVFDRVRPNIVINCVGVVKQLAQANDVLSSVPINTLLPHKLARLCSLVNARFVHMSTDCVFSGNRGGYVESDLPDAYDLYGRSKLMGEVDYPNAITLRTSIIGHELSGARSLIDWFLSQQGTVSGFTKAIFSGLPTVEIARIIRDFVIPHPEMTGLYHVSAEPISKFDLLVLVASVYGKDIQIVPSDGLVIDRSLDSARFREATGYQPACWTELIKLMHAFN